MPSRGILIAIEGIDGAGKTTQIHNLRKFFEHFGLPVEVSMCPKSYRTECETAFCSLQPDCGYIPANAWLPQY